MAIFVGSCWRVVGESVRLYVFFFILCALFIYIVLFHMYYHSHKQCDECLFLILATTIAMCVCFSIYFCYVFFSRSHFDFSHVFWCTKFIRLIITCTQNTAEKNKRLRQSIRRLKTKGTKRTLHLKVICFMNKCLVLCGQERKNFDFFLSLETKTRDLLETYGEDVVFFPAVCLLLRFYSAILRVFNGKAVIIRNDKRDKCVESYSI